MIIFNNSEYKIYRNLINHLLQSSNCEEMNYIINHYISKLVSSDSSIFLLYEKDGITARAGYIKNIEKDLFNDYLKYYQKFDLYKKAIHSQQNPPVVNRASDYLDYNNLENNEHIANFLKPQNIYHICCMEIIQKNKILASLSLHRSKKHSNFTFREIEILKLLAPIIKNVYLSFNDSLTKTISDKLTPREKQILPMLLKNYSTLELALHFNISINTIKTHIKNILRKTNCSSRFELITKLKKI